MWRNDNSDVGTFRAKSFTDIIAEKSPIITLMEVLDLPFIRCHNEIFPLKNIMACRWTSPFWLMHSLALYAKAFSIEQVQLENTKPTWKFNFAIQILGSLGSLSLQLCILKPVFKWKSNNVQVCLCFLFEILLQYTLWNYT